MSLLSGKPVGHCTAGFTGIRIGAWSTDVAECMGPLSAGDAVSPMITPLWSS